MKLIPPIAIPKINTAAFLYCDDNPLNKKLTLVTMALRRSLAREVSLLQNVCRMLSIFTLDVLILYRVPTLDEEAVWIII